MLSTFYKVANSLIPLSVISVIKLFTVFVNNIGSPSVSSLSAKIVMMLFQ